MPRAFTNDFSWSKSRHEKLQECARAYYFHYYRSWGGWEAGATPEVRDLYLLKKLGNRYTWAGSTVHDTLKNALLNWRSGLPVDPAKMEEWALGKMRDEFRSSRAKSYRTQKGRKTFGGLVEHEYDEVLADDVWKQNAETVRVALGWFFQSRWPALARSLKPAQWLEVDAGADFSSFTLDGVKVFAIPDFAYVDDEGTTVVVDWKTGKVREGYDEQVLGYALYVSQRYRVPLEKVRASLVYLNDGQEHDVRVDRDAVEGFRARFGQSVAHMRGLLADVATNTPREAAAFPQTEEATACARCVFRRPCGRQAAVRAA